MRSDRMFPLVCSIQLTVFLLVMFPMSSLSSTNKTFGTITSFFEVLSMFPLKCLRVFGEMNGSQLRCANQCLSNHQCVGFSITLYRNQSDGSVGNLGQSTTCRLCSHLINRSSTGNSANSTALQNLIEHSTQYIIDLESPYLDFSEDNVFIKRKISTGILAVNQANHNILRGFQIGQVVSIFGTPTARTSFVLKFKNDVKNYNIPLHFIVAFVRAKYANETIIRQRIDKVTHADAIRSQIFPFAIGEPFEIHIVLLPNCYRIFIDGIFLGDVDYKGTQPGDMRFLDVIKDVELHRVIY